MPCSTPRWSIAAPSFTAIATATYDKYETHLLLERLGLPSPPTVLPGTEPPSYPVMVKPRRGSGARSIHPARTPEEAAFFVGYVDEPVMIQRLMGGEEFSMDCLGDRRARCLNVIPRTMLESRGGESIKGAAIDDPELNEIFLSWETIEEKWGTRFWLQMQELTPYEDPAFSAWRVWREIVPRPESPQAAVAFLTGIAQREIDRLQDLIVDLDLDPDPPGKGTCGRCTRCMDRCPTGAIKAPGVVDARLCISYLTIENRGEIPRHLRPKVGDWAFGCDVCQEVCP